jgi:Domain of unknown function (DUF4398)
VFKSKALFLLTLVPAFNLMDTKVMKNNQLSKSYRNIHSVTVCLVVMLLTACSGMKPPTEQMAVSKVAISNATSAGANEFAPLPLKSAMEKMDAAEKAMRDENYELALHLSEQAQVDAKLAATTARTVKAQKAATALQEDNRVLRQEIERKSQ